MAAAGHSRRTVVLVGGSDRFVEGLVHTNGARHTTPTAD
jgi:hypothetical protein